MNPVIKVKVIKVIKDFGFQNIPLSYKIRLNQVRPANKIHPYNHLSEYVLYFGRYIALIWELSMAYPPRL